MRFLIHCFGLNCKLVHRLVNSFLKPQQRCASTFVNMIFYSMCFNAYFLLMLCLMAPVIIFVPLNKSFV